MNTLNILKDIMNEYIDLWLGKLYFNVNWISRVKENSHIQLLRTAIFDEIIYTMHNYFVASCNPKIVQECSWYNVMLLLQLLVVTVLQYYLFILFSFDELNHFIKFECTCNKWHGIPKILRMMQLSEWTFRTIWNNYLVRNTCFAKVFMENLKL